MYQRLPLMSFDKLFRFNVGSNVPLALVPDTQKFYSLSLVFVLVTPGFNVPNFLGFCGSSGETNRHTDTAWPIESVGTIQPAAGFLSLVEDTAPVTTLDHLVSSSGQAPNVITIDVEGGEVEVLLGAGQTLNDYRPEVFVSVHPSFLRGFGKTMHDVFVVFEQHEYRWSMLESDHEIHVWATPRR